MAVAAERVVGVAAALVAAAGFLTVGYRVGGGASAPLATGHVAPSPGASTGASPSPVATRTMPAVFLDLPAWRTFYDTLVVLEEDGIWRRASGSAPEVVAGIPSTEHQTWTRVEGGNVVVFSDRGHDPRATAVWVPLDGGSVRLPGTTSEAVEAFDGRDVWLVSYELSSEDVQRGVARLTDPRTGTVRRRVDLPPFTEVAGAARDGLVLNVLEPPGSAIVWSPDSRRQVRSLDGFVAQVYGPRAVVATESPGCVPRCHFVVETATGKRTRVRGLDDALGPPSLSPDGQWAANLPRDGARVTQLRAVHVESGRAYAGPRATSSALYRIRWSRDARTAYVTLRLGEHWRTVAWRPGTWDIGTVIEESWGSALPE